MVAESNHNIELLLDTDTVDMLEDAADIHDVFGDLADAAGDVDLIETTDGIIVRHDLDTTVSYAGMQAIQAVANDTAMGEDIRNLCQAFLDVAEPCEEGSLLMELHDDGEWREVHAFDPDADLAGDIPDADDDEGQERLEQFSRGLESFIDDHHDPDADPR